MERHRFLCPGPVAMSHDSAAFLFFILSLQMGLYRLEICFIGPGFLYQMRSLCQYARYHHHTCLITVPMNFSVGIFKNVSYVGTILFNAISLSYSIPV